MLEDIFFLFAWSSQFRLSQAKICLRAFKGNNATISLIMTFIVRL